MIAFPQIHTQADTIKKKKGDRQPMEQLLSLAEIWEECRDKMPPLPPSLLVGHSNNTFHTSPTLIQLYIYIY